MNDMHASFHEYFELVEANTNELREEVYRLRYEIFCISQGVFNAKDHPEQIEKDEYDPYSSHMLLKHRSSGSSVGTVRLILDHHSLPNKAFQVEHYMQIDDQIIDINKLPRQHFAEISRFAVLTQFSKREYQQACSEKKSATSLLQNRRRCPDPVLALIVGIVRMCDTYRIRHLISGMNPTLNRLLKGYGFGMRAIGPLTDYYGKRRPYYGEVASILGALRRDHHEIWELVTNFGGICSNPIQATK